MDQTVINLIGAGIMAGLGWFANTLWTRLNDHEKRMNELAVKLAGEYVQSVELAQAITEIKALITTLVAGVHSDLAYIRHRVDGLPLRRQSDPPQ